MVQIVDYGMGNLRSVQKAFERAGSEAQITSDPRRIRDADRLVLPGVGAFADAMHELQARSLVEPIREFVQSGRPFLGICLGLQLLFESSEEGDDRPDGPPAGLGILPGRVVRFDLPAPYKIPHMGWNQIEARHAPAWLRSIPDGSYFYFVHSYYVAPDRDEDVAFATEYGMPFCSAVARDNIFASQFHPEKSQRRGAQLIEAFLTQ